MNAREFSRQVAKRRKELGLSQEALAQKAHISRNYVSLIERGIIHNVSVKVLNQLAAALGATPGELTGQSEQEDAVIPPALRELGVSEGLSYDTVDRLSRIPLPGQEPRTVAEWRALYRAVRRYVEDEDSANSNQ